MVPLMLIMFVIQDRECGEQYPLSQKGWGVRGWVGEEAFSRHKQAVCESFISAAPRKRAKLIEPESEIRLHLAHTSKEGMRT